MIAFATIFQKQLRRYWIARNGPPSIFSEWPNSRRARLRELTEAASDELLRARILRREEHMLRGVELDQLAEIHEAGKV